MCEVYMGMASIYSSLGYSGRASHYDNKAHEISEKSPNLPDKLLERLQLNRAWIQLEDNQFDACEKLLDSLDKKYELKDKLKLNRDEMSIYGALKYIRSQLHSRQVLSLQLENLTSKGRLLDAVSPCRESKSYRNQNTSSLNENSWSIRRKFIESWELSGKLYDMLGDHTVAIEYYKQSIELSHKWMIPSMSIRCLLNRFQVDFKLNLRSNLIRWTRSAVVLMTLRAVRFNLKNL